MSKNQNPLDISDEIKKLTTNNMDFKTRQLIGTAKSNSSLSEKEKKIFFEKLAYDNLDSWGIRTEVIVRYNLNYRFEEFIKIIKYLKSNFEQLDNEKLLLILNANISITFDCIITSILESRCYICQKNMIDNKWNVYK
mgnify:CR=1 FL=1|jgi:hypothetical protein